MSKKNNPKFQVGAYWVSTWKKNSIKRKLHGISLWKVKAVKDGNVFIAKVKVLKPGRLAQIPANLHAEKWIEKVKLNQHYKYVKDPKAVEVLYG